MSTVSHLGLTFGLLYTREQIEKVIDNLSKEINEYYDNILKKEGHLDLVVVCVLKGAFMLFSDLVKKINHKHSHEFIRCKSYEGTESTGKLIVETQLKPETFTNKHVLLVEDIHDTGHTLMELIRILEEFKPIKVDTVVLVKRPDKPVNIDLKFCGLVCNDFIIGYGLDYEEWGRHFPQIYQKI
jgi:hypoxanthine phosphoribosyltransferase